MSYALKLEDEVRRALGELSIELQEHVLDLFEQLAHHPSSAGPTVLIHHAAYVGGEAAIFRFATLTDDQSRTVVVGLMRYVLFV